jgi:hypothetical protein
MTRNDITGNRIASRPASKSFRENFDSIFGKADSQCADCNGTRKVDGRDCPVCCPTDDGPDERMG